MPSNEKTASAAQSVTSTSRSLLARVRDNESEAWDRLISLYTPLVYYWCRKLQLPEQDIPDVVQDVFKAVAANINRFRKERAQDTFRGWLRTITRSKATDHYRRQQHQPKAAGGTEAYQRLSQIQEDPIDDESEDEHAHSALYLRALELISNNFKERTWQAFWRVVVDGKSPKDVGDELSMRPGAVRVAKSRVLQRLRQEMGELLD